LKKTKQTEGDRKAYYETYENTKKTNDTLIKDMKEENNQLRKEIANLQREMNQKGGMSAEQAEVDEELKKLNAKRMLYDKQRAKVSSLQSELDAYKDELQDLDLEARRPTAEDSPLTRKVMGNVTLISSFFILQFLTTTVFKLV
jgi:DNA-binding transcriptional regulator GbsR (MarR family)